MTCQSFKLLYDRIRSNSGLIFIDTFEEPRLVRELKREFSKDDIQFWSATQGLHAIPREKEADRVKLHHFAADDCRKTPKDHPTTGNILNALDLIEHDSRTKIKNHSHSRVRHIYVLRDPDKFFNNPMPVRKIRDITYLVATAGSTMILTGAGITVPTDLEKDAAFIQLRIPEFENIKDNIIKKRIVSLINLNNDQVTQNNEPDENKLNGDFDIDKVSRACGGLTEDEIINTCSFSLTTKKTLDIPTILEEKRQIINKNDILTYWVCNEKMSDVGGFNDLKSWFDVQKMAMDSEHAPEFKVEQPKAALILGVQGSGKCQSLWTKILMRDKTWKQMGDIQVGDEVATPNGQFAKVSEIFEHPGKERIQVECKDGRSTVCGEEHLWKVYNKNLKSDTYPNGWRVVDTKQLIHLMNSKSDTRRFYIPLMKDSEEGETIDIHPYILGILIGDGCLTGGTPFFTTMDQEVVNKIKECLTSGYKLSEHKTNNKCSSYSIVKTENRDEENYYRKVLSVLGLYGKTSQEKFIPEICYRLSLSDKIELISGLMDSDGSTDDNLSYSTISPTLAIGVQHLIRSIGGQAHITHRDTSYTYNGEKKQGKHSYRINIRYNNPKELVYLSRKKDKISDNYQYSDMKLEIINVERTGVIEDMRCIMLDDKEHLYITDDFMVTHNTHIAKALAQSWGKGLIKLDMGKVFAGLVGESEKRMRMALHQAEAAGGVVIIDEMDKGLGGAGSSDRTDGGTTKRVIGTFLTWMSEPHNDLFVIATANDISGLLEAHPELLRKGRFDEIWFSDSPTRDERRAIFEIHLRKRGRDPKKFNLDKLADYEYVQNGTHYGLVGSEIEHSIKEAISHKFAECYKGKSLKIGGKEDITDKDIMTQLELIKPISYVGKAPVKRMRDWAKDHARNVSSSKACTRKSKSSKAQRNLNVFAEEDDLTL